MELRPYQREAEAAILNEWDAGILRTLLVLPTGCGKTIVFSKVIEDRVRAGDRVLVLAHRGELLEQAYDKLAQATGLRCATEKADESCLGSWYRVVVGSVQSLMREKRLSRFAHRLFSNDSRGRGASRTLGRISAGPGPFRAGEGTRRYGHA